MKSEILNFRTSSGIKSIVGRDLITDKFVAIFELVKNGYDAKAKKVMVSFNGFENKNDDNPTIVIADDGHGMNKNDLINKWLYLAYSEKQEGHQSDNDRVFVGSKGIGRFSCDTLGSLLTIRTKIAEEDVEHVLHVDWSNFEQDLKKEFGKVSIKYHSNTIDTEESYTILTIENLRHDAWLSESEQIKTKQNLERLKNPFIGDDGFDIYVGQDLDFNNLDPSVRVFNNISEILKDRTTTLEVLIDENIEISLYDRGELIYEASKINDTILKETPIIISIHYLNTSAKNMFTRRMGNPPVAYGNIFIYKNDFRVMPYGEVDYDLFGLNLRKTQGYSRFLGTREIIGYIAIQDKNHFFKESSSRNNGFIQNNYFSVLKDIYLNELHVLLERYVQLIQWGEVKETEEEVFLDDETDVNELDKYKRFITRYKDFELSYFKDDIDVDRYNPEKQLDKLASETENEDTKKTIRKIKKQYKDTKEERDIEEKKRLQSEEKIRHIEKQNKNLRENRKPSSYSEQISHHFKYMAEALYFATEDMLAVIPKLEDKNIMHKLLELISDIRSTQKELIVFQNLLITTDIDMRSDQIINWYEQAKLFCSEQNKKNYGISVVCNIENDNFIDQWDIQCNVLQYQIALENFYQNARENEASMLDILFTRDSIIFSSDSSVISDIHHKKIFELGYTTKPNGTGIGLYQILKFFSQYHFSIVLEQDEQVSFLIKKGDKNAS